jgi:uncharacterized protein YggU (UPF0235/DUF167 family)
VATQPIVMQVKVKPNARASTLTQSDDGIWLAQIKAAPIDGKTNEELISLIATYFHCRKSAVAIKSGASGRMKLVRVEKYNISS